MRSPTEAFGDYVVYEQIGLGGMATVHRAEAKGIAGFTKEVALKRMLPSVAADAKLVQSFIREARLASNMRHANVAQTYELGKVGETYFIAMELVPGRNLREILKHCASIAGPMPLPIAMNIVNQICDALDYAHDLCDESGQPLGIIHRDVSPANIIVSEGGVVKLIDFGIAKAQGAGMQTQSGTIKGKFSYMAPEYLEGYIDARADLFALGVIAHELLCNRPLFQGRDEMDTLYRLRDMPIPLPSRTNPQVPPEIDHIVMTALDRDPDKRWQRATAMRQALTTETQRLGLVAHGQQVFDWIEGAFVTAQHIPREQSEPSIVMIVPDAPQPPSSDFDVPTKAERAGARRDANEWSSPSVVETRAGKAMVDWNTPSVVGVPAVDTHEAPTRAAAPVVPAGEWGVHEAKTRAAPPPAGEWSIHEAKTRADRPPVGEWSAHEARTRASPPLDAWHATEAPTRAGAPIVDWNDPDTLADRPKPRSSQPHVIQRAAPSGSFERLGSAPVARATSPSASTHGGVVRPPFERLGTQQPDAMRPDRPSAPHTPSAGTQSAEPASARGGAGRFLLAVLVLLAAGGATAVVYFALP